MGEGVLLRQGNVFTPVCDTVHKGGCLAETRGCLAPTP